MFLSFVSTVLRNNNNEITSNKIKHVLVEKKPTDLTKKVSQISRKGYNFLLGRIYFKGSDDYQIFIVFPPMLNMVTLDSNENVTN